MQKRWKENLHDQMNSTSGQFLISLRIRNTKDLGRVLLSSKVINTIRRGGPCGVNGFSRMWNRTRDDIKRTLNLAALTPMSLSPHFLHFSRANYDYSPLGAAKLCRGVS